MTLNNASWEHSVNLCMLLIMFMLLMLLMFAMAALFLAGASATRVCDELRAAAACTSCRVPAKRLSPQQRGAQVDKPSAAECTRCHRCTFV